jgi:aspartyl-tRNA(Asn)/glutamyl-tRNA(Gln) amidotransferase subunit A
MEHIIRELDGAMLLMPTVKHVAPPLKELETDTKLFGRVNIATLSLTMIGSFLNMPGVALPTCRDVGAETSALLSGAFGCDDVVLSAALWVENSTQNGTTVYDDRLAGDVGGKIRREEKV